MFPTYHSTTEALSVPMVVVSVVTYPARETGRAPRKSVGATNADLMSDKLAPD